MCDSDRSCKHEWLGNVVRHLQVSGGHRCVHQHESYTDRGVHVDVDISSPLGQGATGSSDRPRSGNRTSVTKSLCTHHRLKILQQVHSCLVGISACVYDGTNTPRVCANFFLPSAEPSRDTNAPANEMGEADPSAPALLKIILQ